MTKNGKPTLSYEAKEKLIALLHRREKKTLEEFILLEPAFDFLFKDGIGFFGSKYHFYKNEPQSLITLVGYFLQSAENDGAEKTADNIEKYLNADKLNGLVVLSLCGICPDEPISINEKVKLIPYINLPDSYYKAVFNITAVGDDFSSPHFPKEFMKMRENPIGRSFYDTQMRPTAAITYSLIASKEELVKVEDYVKIRRDLINVCRSLAIIEKSAATPIAIWWQADDWIKCWPGSQGSTSLEIFDLINRNNVMLKNGEIGEKIMEVCSTFLALKDDDQEKLYIPLSRLNNAIIRKDYIDKAVELGIAIESIFINDNNTEEVAKKIRTRAKKLLAEKTNLFKAKEIKNLFCNLYDYRSRVVHGVNFKFTEDQKNDIEDGILKTAKIIEIILSKYKNMEDFWREII